MDMLLGLDLGQAFDPTALCVLRRAMLLKCGVPIRDHRRLPKYRFDCVHLERYPLGTSYPDIVAKVQALTESPRIPLDSRLVVDATGVGRAVVDLFIEAKLSVEIIPVTLTSGRETKRDRWNKTACVGYWTPKNEVVGVTQTLLQTERLKIARTLPLADTLKQELLAFRMKITAAANETFNAREGAHDDILLAVAIAAWFGMQKGCYYRGSEPDDAGRLAFDEEVRLEREAIKREEDDEKERKQREWLSLNNPALWTRGF